MFPDASEAQDLLHLFETLQLCSLCDSEGEIEYEFPGWIFIDPNSSNIWSPGGDFEGFLYGGLRLQPPRGMDRDLLGSLFPRLQVQIRRSMQEFHDPMEAELSQYLGISKISSGKMEAIINLHNKGQAIEIKVRGPNDQGASCFYFMEDLVALVDETVAEVAPGLPLERHFLSPRDLSSHSSTPSTYPPSSLMEMQLNRRTTLKSNSSSNENEKDEEETFLNVCCFGAKDVALSLTLGIDLPISQLPIYARRSVLFLFLFLYSKFKKRLFVSENFQC